MIGRNLKYNLLISSVFFYSSFIEVAPLLAETEPQKMTHAAPSSTQTNPSQTETEASTDEKHIDPFPFFPIKAVSMGATQTNDHDKDNSTVPHVTAYFSPTCGHCGELFKDQLPTIREKYINTYKMRFSFRPFCHHPIDFIVTQIALCRGKSEFLTIFTRFMTGQSEWFELLLIPEKETEKRADVIRKMIEKLPDTPDKNATLVRFNINESNQKSSVILFALSIGITADEIDQALNSTDANEVYNKLIVTMAEAKDENGNAVPGIPVFYINNEYESDPLKISKNPEEDDFESIVNTGKRAKKKEVAQTLIPKTTPTLAETPAQTRTAP